MDGKDVERAEQRLAARIACDVPLRMMIDGSWRDVTVVDVSRTGVRLRVPYSSLDIDPDVGLADVADELDRVLPPRAQAKFHPQRLGDLICRGIKVVRMVMPGGEQIELGCVLDEPLGEIEAAALGLPVPLETPQAAPPAEEPAPKPCEVPASELQTTHRFRATVMPTGKGRVEPLVADTDRVDGRGVTFTVRDVSLLGLPEDDDDIRPRVKAFSEIYGPDVTLNVLEGTTTAFHGPASLARVEAVPDDPRQLVVGFTFLRDLQVGEQRALRLL